jgi:outer membrane protein TolC
MRDRPVIGPCFFASVMKRTSSGFGAPMRVPTRKQRVHLQAQRAAPADALNHASRRYRAGYSSYLEQLDAERGVLGADLALVQALADELNASVALSQAMGRG